MQKIRTKINEKWMQDGILHIKAIEGVHIDLPSLLEDDAVNDGLTGGKKARALYDGRAFFTITAEAREYLNSGILNRSRIATAVVTDKLALKLIVNFMIRFNKPASPLKLFRSEKKALEWLKEVGIPYSVS